MAQPDQSPRRNSALRLMVAREARRWHWISSAVCLVMLMMFAASGVTLNHSALFEPEPRTENRTLAPTAEVRALVAAGPSEAETPLPAPVEEWLAREAGVRPRGAAASWAADSVTLTLSRPGGETIVTFERPQGAVTVERSSRGAVGLVNDLHTGRYTPRLWNGLMDVFAAACLVFAGTGLTLLALNAKGRRLTWPLVAAGLAIPLAILLLAAHLG